MIIESITGTAQAFGKTIQFRYDHQSSVLHVHGVTLEEAKAIVTVAEEGLVADDTPAPKVKAAQTNGVLPGQLPLPVVTLAHVEPRPALSVDKGKMAALAASNPAKAPKPAKDLTEQLEASVEAAKGKKKAPEPPPKADEAGMVPNEHGVLQPKGLHEEVALVHGLDSSPANKTAHKAAPSAVEGVSEEVVVVHELLSAKKLRDVLTHVMEKEGVTDPDALKARCIALQPLVPCLTRIADLDSRIDRTLEVMDMTADLS